MDRFFAMKCSKKAVFFIWGLAWGMGITAGVCLAQTRVDLQVESLKTQPPRPEYGQPVEVTAAIRNNGSEPAENFFLSLEIRRGGKRVRVISNIPALGRLPRLGSGQAIPVSVGILPAGSYEIIAVVDPDDTIAETNEANNERSLQFQVSE